jgi:hypothetical protein
VDHIRSVEELGNCNVDVFLCFVHGVYLLRFPRMIYIIEILAIASVRSVIVNKYITTIPVLLCEDLLRERISLNLKYQQVTYIVPPRSRSVPVEIGRPNTSGGWIALIGKRMPTNW